MRRITLCGALVLAGAGVRADEPVKIMSVFVTAAKVEARKDVDEASERALKASRDQTQAAREAKEKDFKNQFGKKRKNWARDKDDELLALEQAEALSKADYEYREVDPEAIGDAVKRIARVLAGKGPSGMSRSAFKGRTWEWPKKHVALVAVATAAEAELVVEVLGQRTERVAPWHLNPDGCYVYFAIGPGGKLDATRFANVPTDYGRRGASIALAGPSPESPVFRFESDTWSLERSADCYGGAAMAAAAAVERFAEDNRARLLPEP